MVPLVQPVVKWGLDPTILDHHQSSFISNGFEVAAMQKGMFDEELTTAAHEPSGIFSRGWKLMTRDSSYANRRGYAMAVLL